MYFPPSTPDVITDDPERAAELDAVRARLREQRKAENEAREQQRLADIAESRRIDAAKAAAEEARQKERAELEAENPLALAVEELLTALTTAQPAYRQPHISEARRLLNIVKQTR